jgi:hypothetical protein
MSTAVGTALDALKVVNVHDPSIAPEEARKLVKQGGELAAPLREAGTIIDELARPRKRLNVGTQKAKLQRVLEMFGNVEQYVGRVGQFVEGAFNKHELTYSSNESSAAVCNAYDRFLKCDSVGVIYNLTSQQYLACAGVPGDLLDAALPEGKEVSEEPAIEPQPSPAIGITQSAVTTSPTMQAAPKPSGGLRGLPMTPRAVAGEEILSPQELEREARDLADECKRDGKSLPRSLDLRVKHGDKGWSSSSTHKILDRARVLLEQAGNGAQASCPPPMS